MKSRRCLACAVCARMCCNTKWCGGVLGFGFTAAAAAAATGRKEKSVGGRASKRSAEKMIYEI